MGGTRVGESSSTSASARPPSSSLLGRRARREPTTSPRRPSSARTQTTRTLCSYRKTSSNERRAPRPGSRESEQGETEGAAGGSQGQQGRPDPIPSSSQRRILGHAHDRNDGGSQGCKVTTIDNR